MRTESGASYAPPHQTMIVNAFNSQTYIENRMDVQHEPLYDTLTFAAAATITENTGTFFTNVGPASGKTLAGTNLTRANELPSPEAFSIFSIRIRWAEDAAFADVVNLLNGFALELTLGRKAYNTGPIWHYNAGGGVFGATTQTAQSILVNGEPGREAMHKLAIPIVIENQMEFQANLRGNNLVLAAGGAGGTGLTLQLLLDGLHARGVQ